MHVSPVPIVHRFISQRQYKRKIRREGNNNSGNARNHIKYSTLDARTEKRLSAAKSPAASSAVLVSKTTFKLRKSHVYNSDLDSAGEESYTDGGRACNGGGLELMEIPLSPTHYNQPATPEHPPPTPWEAESAIHSVLAFLKNEYQPATATTATLTEPWMLLPLDTAQWPADPPALAEKSTCTQLDRKVPSGRKLPAIPREAAVGQPAAPVHLHIATSPESEEDSSSEVVLRRGGGKDESIYQSIEQEERESDSGGDSSNRVSQSSDKSQSLSILSPFDEQEEWSKISQIIDSFGADIGKQTEGGRGDATTPNNSPVYDYPTLKKREKLASTIEEWLSFINLRQYVANFEDNGYDNINYMGGGLMAKEDLLEIGITDPKDISVLLESLRHRQHKFSFRAEGEPMELSQLGSLEDWLASLDLGRYSSNFRDNLLLDLDRIKTIWDDELISIVEIDKIGHRRRILLSVAGTQGLKHRMGKVKGVQAEKPPVSLKISESHEKLKPAPKGKEEASKPVTKPSTTIPPPKTEEKPVKPEPTARKVSSRTTVPTAAAVEEPPPVLRPRRSPDSASSDHVPLCQMHSAQGWKFMSCSHCQELCQQATRPLIGCTKVNNQSEARSAS